MASLDLVFLFVVATTTVARLEQIAGADCLEKIATPKATDEAKWDGGSDGKDGNDCLQY